MDKPSEIVLLSHDCAEVRGYVEARVPVIEAELRKGNSARRNLILVTADLLYRVVDLAQGTGTCLEHKLYSATHAVQRGLVESHVNLMTIYKSSEREQLAWVLACYTRLKRRSLEDDGAEDLLDSILKDVPNEVEQLAASRIKDRKGWSGVSTKRMMDDLGIDYDIYAWTSEEAHGRGIGAQAALFTVAETDKAKLRLGRALEEDSAELIANVSRSMVLNSGSAFWEILTGTPAEFETLDPRTSL